MSDAEMQALDPLDMFLYGARAAAAKHDRYVMLVLGEADAVWLARWTAAAWVLADESYALLSHLAKTGHGGWATLACSTSRLLDDLVEGNDVNDGRYARRRPLNKCRIARI